ncbi:MAG: TraC family protein [Sulfuricaulis sp.]
MNALAKMMNRLFTTDGDDVVVMETEASRYTPTPIKVIRSLIEDRRRLSGLLPYSSYIEEEKVFVNDDSIGFVIEARPQTGATEEMARILTSLFLGCPTGTGIQIIHYASPNLVTNHKAYAGLRHEDSDQGEKSAESGRPVRNDNIFRRLARRRIAFYQKGARKSIFRNQTFLFRNYRLIISVTIPGTGEAKEVKDLVTLRDTFRSTLTSAIFPSIEWSVKDLIKFMSEVLNPQAPNNDFAPNYDDGRLIKEQIVNSDTVCRVTEKGLKFTDSDNRHAELRCYSVKNYPELSTLWEMNGLIGDQIQQSLQYPCPFLLVMGVHILDYEKAKNTAQMKSARATTNSTSQMAKFMPDMAVKKKDWDIAMRSLSEGQSLVSLYHQLLLFADDETAQSAEHAAYAVFRAKNFELANDVYMQPQSLLACLPMTLSKAFYSDLKKAGRVSTKTGDNAVHMSPMIAEWQGTSTPMVCLFGRRGQVMNLDFFDNTAGNYNVAVAAASGAGKSVLLQDVALSYLGAGAKVWIIDVGRSYEKLAKLVGGQFLEFKADSDVRLNPFSMVLDLNEEMDVLKPLVAQMAMPNSQCDDLQKAIIEEAIRTAWAKKQNKMTITDVADSLVANAERGGDDPDWVRHLAAKLFPNVAGKEGAPASLDEYTALLITSMRGNGAQSKDQRILDLAKMLYPFTKNGVYGKYFEGEANIKFDKDFIVLELEELNVKKDLQSVVLLILLYAIQQEMYLTGDRSRKKLMVVDEAWDLMGTGSTGDFIKKGYRRCRKVNGCMITATQSINDYFTNDAGTAIMANSDWVLLLRQKPEAIEQLAMSGRMAMNDTVKRLLASVRTEHGVFSEVYVYSPMGSGIGRLIIDPFSQQLYTTKANEYTAIMKRVDSGVDLSDAIDDILREKGVTV